MNARWSGEGWGALANQISEHAADKAERLDKERISAPFVLLYYSVAGETRSFTPDQLPWAWQEVVSRLDQRVVGVVLLHHAAGGANEWTAHGVLRPDVAALEDLLGVEILSCEPRTETAGAVWTRLGEEAQSFSEDPSAGAHRQEWTGLAGELKACRCDAPASRELVTRALVLASRSGFRFHHASRFDMFSLPLPCAPETILAPRLVPPRS